uniref:Target of Myb protein 1-like n=1 Tax=Pygocentrus nattereri TaxID=42514 RepID=A0A3B4DH74_PYGNA
MSLNDDSFIHTTLFLAEDWGINIEICDIINETEEGPKDAIRAIKKKIVGNKNFREVMLALTVLETCVKNCGHRFHVHVCNREFVEGVLVRTILPKNNPPTILHDRVLSLIQAWADAFRNSPTLAGVVSVYDDLKRRGLEFPMTDLDALSPIHTPSRSIPENGTSAPSVPAPAVSRTHTADPTPTQTPQPPQTNGGPVPISPEQKQKLRAELDLVKGNLTVMTEMLNQLKPGESSPSDTELLQQLYSVCKSMQQRVVELIPCLCEEELIGELLVMNDDLNNAFIRYERFERLSVTQRTPTGQDTGNLIDLNPVTPSVNQTPLPPVSQPVLHPPSNTVVPAEEEEEFDMFAQTRSSSLAEQRKSVRYEDPGAVEGLAGALDTRLQVTGGDETSKWTLQSQWIYSDIYGEPLVEFDKFLAERAKAVEHLPSVQKNSSAGTNPRQQPSQSSKKQESAQDQLFSL